MFLRHNASVRAVTERHQRHVLRACPLPPACVTSGHHNRVVDQESCPRCGSNDVRPIAYGLPGPELVAAAQRREVVLGGCEPEAASRQCLACGERWAPDDDPPQVIARVFRDDFKTWHIELDVAELVPGASGTITKDGWLIRYRVDADEAGDPVLEYYATHRMTSDSHVRIKADGSFEDLDAIRSMYGWNPDRGESAEEARREYEEHNRRVAAELVEKGLYPAGDVNAFLRTGGMDALDALRDARRLFKEWDLPLPHVPRDLTPYLRRRAERMFSTRELDPGLMYVFTDYLVEAVSGDAPDYVAFCHAGHGLNSRAITYHLVSGSLALFVQVPFGVVYGGERAHEIAHDYVSRANVLVRANPPSHPNGRLFVATSAVRRVQRCGWIPLTLTSADAESWVNSNELDVDDALEVATSVLQQPR